MLYACGRLPPDYRHGEGGFDQLLCDRLGIDRSAFVRYIETEKPDYFALERWVLANARDLSPGTIAAFNHRVRTAELPADRAAERRAQLAIGDQTYAHAVGLNDLDDWATLHRELLERPPMQT